MQSSYQPYTSTENLFCFFVKFPRGEVKSRNKRGVRNKGKAFQTTYYKQRTESQNNSTPVDSKTRWQDRCARQETHAWLRCQGKRTQERNHTEMLWEQLLGLPWPNGNNRKNKNPWNYNYKRKLPPQLIHWTCWVSLDVSLGWDTRWHRYSHALVMKAMVSWLATELSLHATQRSWAGPEIKDTTNILYLQ